MVEQSIVKPHTTSAMVVGGWRLFDPLLCDLLRRAGHERVIVSRSGGRATLERVRPSLVVVMAQAGADRPLEAIRRVRAAAPEARIVVLATEADDLWFTMATAMGADATIGSDAADEELVDALSLAD
jgi:DNA-binding NarL/FixJ family response regulator